MNVSVGKWQEEAVIGKKINLFMTASTLSRKIARYNELVSFDNLMIHNKYGLT